MYTRICILTCVVNLIHHIKLTIHLDPVKFPKALVSAGASRITFQLESVYEFQSGDLVKTAARQYALTLAREIRASGVKCGVCIKPSTPVEELEFLLTENFENGVNNATSLIDLVDVLAVSPGFGGQPFDTSVMAKVQWLREQFPELEYIMVDGGVTADTAKLAAENGANVLVAGTSIFGKDRRATGGLVTIQHGIRKILRSLELYGV